MCVAVKINNKRVITSHCKVFLQGTAVTEAVLGGQCLYIFRCNFAVMYVCYKL